MGTQVNSTDKGQVTRGFVNLQGNNKAADDDEKKKGAGKEETGYSGDDGFIREPGPLGGL